jgi:hypothetical protein
MILWTCPVIRGKPARSGLTYSSESDLVGVCGIQLRSKEQKAVMRANLGVNQETAIAVYRQVDLARYFEEFVEMEAKELAGSIEQLEAVDRAAACGGREKGLNNALPVDFLSKLELLR